MEEILRNLFGPSVDEDILIKLSEVGQEIVYPEGTILRNNSRIHSSFVLELFSLKLLVDLIPFTHLAIWRLTLLLVPRKRKYVL